MNPKTKEKFTSQIVRAVTIGRGSDVDIKIDWEPSVSRIHTLIVPRKDGRIEVRDLASSSGTFVALRGQKIKLNVQPGADGFKYGRAILFEGDSFFVGLVKVDVLYEEVLGEPTLDRSLTESEEEEITGRCNAEDI